MMTDSQFRSALDRWITRDDDRMIECECEEECTCFADEDDERDPDDMRDEQFEWGNRWND